MEPQYNLQEKSSSESFTIERKKIRYFGTACHSHKEYELFLNLKGKGIRVVGDDINFFEAPELILLGRNVPHLFKNDEKNRNESIDYVVLKFGTSISGQNVFNLPEFAQIKRLLANAKRGLLFSDKAMISVKEQLISLFEYEGVDRLLLFMTILKTLSETEDYSSLASEGFVNHEEKILNAMEYIAENYRKDVSLGELAEVTNMTPNSFCRFFKKRTNKTAFQVLREFRVKKACQLLVKGEHSIAQICYDTGFNSLSSFNRTFKNIKNVSATEYKSKHLIVAVS